MRRYAAIWLSAVLLAVLACGCSGSGNEEATAKADSSTEAASSGSGEASSEAGEASSESGEASSKSGEAAAGASAGERESLYDKKVDIKAPKKVDQLSEPEEGETVAVLHVKDYGDICVKFFPEDSPLAVENFLTLAANGYYDGITFHRVIADFMIQGGDPTGTGTGGESMWGEEFENEYSDRLAHINGALAMARTSEPDTNGSQFFINDGPELSEDTLGQYDLSEDLKAMYKERGGNPFLQGEYTVFGQVYEGMEVVDAISKTATDTTDKPVEDIVIESIDVTEYAK